MKQLVTVVTVRREMYKPAPSNDVTTRWERDGFLVCDTFEVVVDPVKLVRAIGDDALRTKTLTSKLQSGAVVVKAIGARRVPT